jgi:hypothetical protein
MKKYISLLLLLLCLSSAAAHAEGAFTAVWMPNDRPLAASQIQDAIAGVTDQNSDPQAIVVLIHGWMTPRWLSDDLYGIVASKIRADYDRRGERVAIVGLDWPSDVGRERTWVPQLLVHDVAAVVGLGNRVANPYTSRVYLARAIGHRPARQLLLALQQRFPQAALDVYAYSMGAEIIASAMGGRPHGESARTAQPSYESAMPLQINLLYLAGADLGDDVLEDWPITAATAPRLMWLTQPRPGNRDHVLAKRKLAQTRPALGNTFPRMTLAQLDYWIGGRHLLVDMTDVPANHDYLTYYEPERLRRLADASADLRDGSLTHSRDLRQLAEVAAAPDTVEALRPYLDADLAATQLLAIYRLDRLVDGSAACLQNGEQLHLLAEMRTHPDRARRAIARSRCGLVRAGLFPTPAMWAATNPPHATTQAVAP